MTAWTEEVQVQKRLRCVGRDGVREGPGGLGGDGVH